MVILGFVWLALLVFELTVGGYPWVLNLSFGIWVIFILAFIVEISLAPAKLRYLRRNWLTAVSLLVPALRVFQVFRAIRALRAVRAVRSLRLVRVVSSMNRSMMALRRTLGRRGFSYVALLTLMVALGGGAGMFALENGSQGFQSYPEALWWTSMLLTTMGSSEWPLTPEGRTLALILSLYAFGVFGYVTATITSFLVGRDAVSDEGELASARAVAELRAEMAVLSGDVRAALARSDPEAKRPG